MSDFDDITCDYESEPRLSDLDMPWPTEDAIRGMIRAANHWHRDAPVSDAMVKAFRRGIIARAYAAWHARRRRQRVRPLPVGWSRRQKRWYATMCELLDEPWFQVGAALMTGYSALVMWSARELLMLPFRDAPVHMGSSLRVYVQGKLGVPGEHRRSWNAWAASPLHIAAVNAVSLDSAHLLYERVNSACRNSHHEEIDRLYDELDNLGLRIIRTHGEWLSAPMPGPPRALVPLLPAEIEKARAAKKKLEEEAAAPAQPAVPDAPAGGGRSR